MKKSILVAVLLLGCCALAMAEEIPKAEILAGYSFYRCNPEGVTGNCDLNGWIASLSANATKWFGAVAEFNGNYGSVEDVDSVRVMSFMFGPRVYIRKNDKVTPFVHALFGDTYIHAKAGRIKFLKENDFSMAFGGGLDLKVGKFIAARPFQVDYVTFDPKQSARMHNFRFAAGIIFKLGERGN